MHMAFNPNEHKIDERERDLYSRNAPPESVRERSTFTQSAQPFAVSDTENPSPSKDVFAEALEHEYEKSPTSNSGNFFKKFFIGASIFFGIAVVTFLFMQFGGFNTVSSKNVDITVQGPVAVGGGEELVLDVLVTNNNTVPLERAELLIEYPSGTRLATDLSQSLDRYTETLGPIAPKQSVTKTVKAVLFGEKNSVKNIKMSVDYTPTGSNSTFTKEKIFEIAIKSAPILLAIDYPKEVNSNQAMSLDLTVTSNSNTLTEDVLVKVEYPFGFTFESATPAPSFDDNIWSFDALSPLEQRIITISGKMEGQNDEEKTFRFNAGTASLEDDKVIGVDFVALAESVLIRKPFFGIQLSVAGDDSQNPVIKIDREVNSKLTWTNNLPVPVNDVVIEVKLGGNALDRNNISASDQGFYQSANDTITWDKRVVPALAEVDPGATDSFDFEFDTIKITPQLLAALRNPLVNLDVVIKGTRFYETQPPEEITYAFSRQARVITEPTFTPRVVYSVGPFTNTGAIPPRAEKPTTYTVLWTVSNSFNDIGNTNISTTLPPYMTWVGTTYPTNENIIYNPATNQVVWEPGEIKAGVGFGGSPREVAFQLSFLPSLGQVGDVPDITGEMIFTTLDRFTNEIITIKKPPLTTRMSTDPEFDFGDDTVVK